jgi:4,5-dihydroxyphthalate decarboxylase
MKLYPEEIFFRAFRSEDFDICECSLSSFTVKTAAGQCPYVGVPAFVSRMFRHTSMYCRTDRIEKPQDLKGKKVGLPEYQLTANVWARAILEDDFGVKPSDIHWIRGGIEHTGRPEKITIKLPDGVRLDNAPEGKTISQLLLDGEIDGFMAPRPPSFMTPETKNVGWLFRDPTAAAKDWFKRTGIFPIMHLVTLRRDVHEKYPFAASSLYEALKASRERALARMRDTGALRYMLPWMTADLDEIDEVFGGDPWPNGIEANRKTLEALVTYLHEQGLIAKKMPIEDIFVKTFESH